MSPFTLRRPTGPAVPLVCDSPHSGTWYPDDYRPAVPLPQLRGGEDTHVDALWGAVPAVGGTLLAAHFPRTYIDPNRSEDDLDPGLLDAPWPTPLAPGEKTRLGFGLVWRNIRAGVPIYDRKLSVAEVQARIERCWRPYHQALAGCIEQARRDSGAVWHLNLHSMPNDAYQRLQIDSPRPLADFVLGDRDGRTCEPAFVDLVERELRGFGYSVARNDPYKGVQLIERIGQPQLRRHSLQVEIRRPLYMDEATREPNEGFAPLQADLTRLLHTLAGYVRAQLAP
ncbi:N-formylglutamate amidohydrolase [Ramlibacter sp.]|uniref:N-formylglutamate amidohydrolase n=1 Tax=Ramlibacter sp. TaxID=1917967 RepID=UPI002FC950A9